MKLPERLRSIYICPCQINGGRVATALGWNVHTAALCSLTSASVNMHIGHTLQMFNVWTPHVPTVAHMDGKHSPKKERRLGDTSTKIEVETMQV